MVWTTPVFESYIMTGFGSSWLERGRTTGRHRPILPSDPTVPSRAIVVYFSPSSPNTILDQKSINQFNSPSFSRRPRESFYIFYTLYYTYRTRRRGELVYTIFDPTQTGQLAIPFSSPSPVAGKRFHPFFTFSFHSSRLACGCPSSNRVAARCLFERQLELSLYTHFLTLG